MAYWLIKSDPETYSWDNLVKDKKTNWDGVRNYQARNNLNLMKKKDKLLFYNSQLDRSVVGIAEVTKEAFPDPTAKEGSWVAVEIKPIKKLKKPYTLKEIKENKELENIALIKQTRLSVMLITKEEFEIITNS